jgi:hypothetical protein
MAAKMFDEIAPKYADRNGGYTRIIKIGQRKGDGAMEVLDRACIERDHDLFCFCKNRVSEVFISDIAREYIASGFIMKSLQAGFRARHRKDWIFPSGKCPDRSPSDPTGGSCDDYETVFSGFIFFHILLFAFYL